MIWIRAGATLADLTRLIAGGMADDEVEGVRRIPTRTKGMLLAWGTSPTPRDLPGLLLVERGKQREVLAWLRTYAPQICPFTAFCRVLEPDLANILEEGTNDNATVVPIMVSLIRAEAFMHQWHVSQERPGFRACLRTASYGFSRALALGYPSAVERVQDGIERLRSLTEPHERSFSGSSFISAFRVLSELAAASPANVLSFEEQAIETFCRRRAATDRISGEELRTLLPGLRQADSIAELRALVVERRVGVFNAACVDLELRAQTDARAAFVLGFILSQISEMSLGHWHLVERVARGAELIGSWYALCVGVERVLRRERDDWDVVDRRVEQELLRPFEIFERPRCDFSITELEVLADVHGAPQVASSPNLADGFLVEVLPGVVVSGREQRRQPTPQQLAFVEEPPNFAIDRISQLADELAQLARELAGGKSRKHPKRR